MYTPGPRAAGTWHRLKLGWRARDTDRAGCARAPGSRRPACPSPAYARVVHAPNPIHPHAAKRPGEPPVVEVVIEVPRGSFLKRGGSGHIDFVSPLPCPFNYGAVPTLLGLEGDLLDALVLGPHLALGARVRVQAWGAITLTDRGMSDDKLVCSHHAPSRAECHELLRFFRFYARCKGLLNLWRRRPGRNACEGWCEASDALARARALPEAWRGPPVGF